MIWTILGYGSMVAITLLICGFVGRLFYKQSNISRNSCASDTGESSPKHDRRSNVFVIEDEEGAAEAEFQIAKNFEISEANIETEAVVGQPDLLESTQKEKRYIGKDQGYLQKP